jgi:hypothetical protein
MAILGGIGGSILIAVVGGILVWGSASRKGIIFGSMLVICVMLAILALVPGNLTARFPYMVEVRPGVSVKIFAPLKKLEIPVEEIRDVRHSVLRQGYVVRLKRRRRLLKSFVVHWFFGAEGTLFAQSLENALGARKSRLQV